MQGIPIDQILSTDQGLSLGLSTTGLGMIIVFIGLILLVFITWMMSKAIAAFAKKTPAAMPAAPVAPAPVQDRGELAAVIAASVASAMDTLPEGLRIHSIKKR